MKDAVHLFDLYRDHGERRSQTVLRVYKLLFPWLEDGQGTLAS